MMSYFKSKDYGKENDEILDELEKKHYSEGNRLFTYAYDKFG